MPRLTDRIALVTGAARGIGEAIAHAFAREGAVVVLSDIDDDAGLAAARRIGRRAVYERLDVREERDWDRVMERVLSAFGGIDVLVNNAGITGFEQSLDAQDPEHASLASWRAVHATNLDGVFLGCRAGIRAMRAAGAGQESHSRSIINISSRSGLVGIPAAAAYASSKAAVRNHTKSVALYCAGEGLNIRCNSIHPAAILTPMWEAMLGDGDDREQRMEALVRDTPLRRFGTVDEVAYTAVFLAADESAYTTGAEFVLDGGILAGSTAAPRR